jgi:hypothetical protein
MLEKEETGHADKNLRKRPVLKQWRQYFAFLVIELTLHKLSCMLLIMDTYIQMKLTQPCHSAGFLLFWGMPLSGGRTV